MAPGCGSFCSGQGMTGRAISGWNWRIYRAADHLCSRLFHASVWSVRLQPAQQCLEIRGSDGVGITVIADVVKHQLHPATTMLLGRRGIPFDSGDDLFRASIERPERVGERCRLKTVHKQVIAILADLVVGGSVLEMLQVGMCQSMSRDLVPGRIQVLQLRP